MSKRISPNDDELIQLYQSGLNLRQICDKFGLSIKSRGNLSLRLRKNGIEIRKDAGIYHHGWKGGRISKGDGYIGIWKPEHCRADKQGYVFEHTLVYEQNTGILPEKNQNIHHINCDKLDNKFENLWLCDKKQHLYCHRSIEKLIKPLMEKGIIEFENGIYKIKE